jgi:hypothetical protein
MKKELSKLIADPVGNINSLNTVVPHLIKSFTQTPSDTLDASLRIIESLIEKQLLSESDSLSLTFSPCLAADFVINNEVSAFTVKRIYVLI